MTSEDNKYIPSLPLGGKLLMASYNMFKDYHNNTLNENLQDYLLKIKKLDDKLKAFQASTKISSEILNNTMLICSEIGFGRQLAIDVLTLYMKATKLFKNSSLKFTKPTIAAACLFVASRLHGGDRILSLSEVVKVYSKVGHRIVKSKVAWCASIINKKLIEKPIPHKHVLKNYLERFINVLQKEMLDERNKTIKITSKIPLKLFINLVKDESLEIVNKFETLKLQGKNPLILAATILYLANKSIAERIGIKSSLSQKEIANVCNVPEYSIRDNIPFVLKFIRQAQNAV
ncbi:MAG: hypothetical protein RXR31_00050 [Thermoproteota archaeon]|jgi:Transcription initiation factor TFIIIB, Brf1 subunit/Transcription initiation factor TFIIB